MAYAACCCGIASSASRMREEVVCTNSRLSHFYVLSVYEGWLLHTGTGAKPESIHRKDKLLSLAAEADGDERDRNAFLWRVRALAKAALKQLVLANRWGLLASARKVLDAAEKVGRPCGNTKVDDQCRSETMKLVETLKNRTEALKVAEIAKLLGCAATHL